MRREQSQQSPRAERDQEQATKPVGTLFLIGVPIGHPDDITIRALAVLKQVDIVATEDPLATQILLRHHSLSAHLTSYGPTKIRDKVAILIDRLQQGRSVALLSDCGSPAISDPGSLLISAAHKLNIPVLSIPGPSAVTAAIAASGFPAESFHFYGNITTSTGSRRRRLETMLAHVEPTVMFCQLKSCLAILKTISKTHPRREIVLACDLTLEQEKVLKGTARRISEQLKRIQPPQAITMIVAGNKSTGRKAGNRSAA